MRGSLRLQKSRIRRPSWFSELADGKLMLKFEAVPGTYHLQRSENLTEWELDRELKPEQAETTVEVPLAPDALGYVTD